MYLMPFFLKRQNFFLTKPILVAVKYFIWSLAALIAVASLNSEAAVFIPLMVSLMLTYALAPLVDLLERWKISRWIVNPAWQLVVGALIGS